MSSLVVSNTFVDGTTILATPMNTNFDDIETYVNNRNSGASSWERVLATNASSVPAVFNNGAGTNDILNAQDNGTNVFRVADAGNVVIGSAALATTATDGFLYVESCAGTPTGVPTAFTGRVPIVFDSTNNLLYIYDGGWITSQPSVDNSTIEISGGNLQVKNAGISTAKLASSLTVQTLDVGTALSWKTFNQLKILQIVVGTTTTSSNTNSATFVDSNLTVSITPKINGSKILVFAAAKVQANAGNTAYFTLARGTTNLSSSANGFCTLSASTNDDISMIAYDSPATTSATNYLVRFRTDGGGGAVLPPAAGAPEAVIMAIEIAQ